MGRSVASVFRLLSVGSVILLGVVACSADLEPDVAAHGVALAGPAHDDDADIADARAGAAPSGEPGLADQRPDPADLPENAQVVALSGGGYMVPYEAEIPGFGVIYHMTPIPGGTFIIGSPPDEPGRKDDEGPQFEVEVEPFWMGTYEITWGEYRAFMQLYEPFRDVADDQRRRIDEPPIPDDQLADAVTVPTPIYYLPLRYEYGGDDAHPAVTMKPYAARQYTKFLSRLTGRFYRLPTEAEWEYAARAGTITAWSFGDDEGQLGQYARHFDPWSMFDLLHLLEPADDGYLPVGSLRPNPWGLYDMHGNVAEIVIDQYVADHYAQFAEVDGPLDAFEVIAWPSEVSPIVVRGGSWDHDPEDTRSAARWQTDDVAWTRDDVLRPTSPWWFAGFESQMTGFRIVRPLHEPDEQTKHRFWGSREQDLPEETWEALSDLLGPHRRGVYVIVDKTLLERIEARHEQKAREREELERRREAAREETLRLIRERNLREAERRRSREAEADRELER